jgi:hypothetical protein
LAQRIGAEDWNAVKHPLDFRQTSCAHFRPRAGRMRPAALRTALRNAVGRRTCDYWLACRYAKPAMLPINTACGALDLQRIFRRAA